MTRLQVLLDPRLNQGLARVVEVLEEIEDRDELWEVFDDGLYERAEGLPRELILEVLVREDPNELVDKEADDGVDEPAGDGPQVIAQRRGGLDGRDGKRDAGRTGEGERVGRDPRVAVHVEAEDP